MIIGVATAPASRSISDRASWAAIDRSFSNCEAEAAACIITISCAGQQPFNVDYPTKTQSIRVVQRGGLRRTGIGHCICVRGMKARATRLEAGHNVVGQLKVGLE